MHVQVYIFSPSLSLSLFPSSPPSLFPLSHFPPLLIQVANTDCPSSHPLNVDYNIKCSGGYTNHYTYNVTVNATNGSIIQHGKPSLSLGLCNCRALITWYNRNNNNSHKYINFSKIIIIIIIYNRILCL